MSSVDQPPAEAPPEDAPAEAPPAEPAAEDPYRAVLEGLKADLGDALLDTHSQRGELWVRVDVAAWKRVAEVCRRQLGFDYFCFLSGIDWMPHTWPNPKVEEAPADGQSDGETETASEGEGEPEPEPEQDPPAGPPAGGGKWPTGVAGGASRFQLLARLYSTTRHLGVTFKADLDDTTPTAPTWSDVYPGADWHERETWEMYGFEFAGHPNLTHLYLPSGFEGFPLRKDFPLLSREVKPWPGLVDVEPFPPGTADGGSEDAG